MPIQPLSAELEIAPDQQEADRHYYRAILQELIDMGADIARQATDESPTGERYDAWQRRREEAVAAAWNSGRADPRVAGELDRFMAAAGERFGAESIREVWRAEGREGGMTLPGVGREHQAGLDEIARQLPRALDGVTLSQERERQGLPRQPEQDRERQRQERGLGLGR